MKKMIGLSLVAGMALTLAACDWGKTKPAEPPVGNEQSMGNEAIVENAMGGNETIDNATLVDQAGPETNVVEGNTM